MVDFPTTLPRHEDASSPSGRHMDGIQQLHRAAGRSTQYLGLAC